MRRIVKRAFLTVGVLLLLLIPAAFLAAEINGRRDPAVLAERTQVALDRAAFSRTTLAGMETRPADIRDLAERAKAAADAVTKSGVPLKLQGAGGPAGLTSAVRRSAEAAPILGVSSATLSGDRWTLDLVAAPIADPAALRARFPKAVAFLEGTPLPTPHIWERDLIAVPSIAAEYAVQNEEARAKTLDETRTIDLELAGIARAQGAFGRARRTREVVELLAGGARPAIAAGDLRFDASLETAFLALSPAKGHSAESIGSLLQSVGALATFDPGDGERLSIDLLLR